MKVTVILPYFGTLPNYFHLWLESASHNKEFNFLLILDEELSVELPSNVTVIYKTFAEIQNLIHSKLGKLCQIGVPYKLCDYKPTYGVLFSEYLSDSDWWGYCDPDIVWGNLSAFITKDMFDSYDRILTLGHLSLFRNTSDNNNAYKKIIDMQYTSFEAFHFYKSVAFDETGAKSLSDYGIYHPYDNRKGILDIWPRKFKFRTEITRGVENFFIAEYNNGHIYGHFVEDGKVSVKEFMYIHLQKRKMDIETKDTNRYMIIPNKFVPYDESLLSPDNIVKVNSLQDLNFTGGNNRGHQNLKSACVDRLIEFIRLLRRVFYKIGSVFRTKSLEVTHEEESELHS